MSFGASRLLQLLAHCWHWRPAEKLKTSDCSTSQQLSCTHQEMCLLCSIRLLESSSQAKLYRTRKGSKLWVRSYSRALSSDGWAESKVFPRTLFHGGHVATTTCRGEDFHVEASAKDWSRSKQRYETSRDQEARCRGFQQHDTFIEHKTLYRVVCRSRSGLTGLSLV